MYPPLRLLHALAVDVASKGIVINDKQKKPTNKQKDHVVVITRCIETPDVAET